MPELPEVETTRRGIAPHIVGQKIIDVTVRDRRLRGRFQVLSSKILSVALLQRPDGALNIY